MLHGGTRGLIVGLLLLAAACTPAPVPTVIVLPTDLPTAPPTALPTLTATPAPRVSDYTVTVSAGAAVLPADQVSTAPVTMTIRAVDAAQQAALDGLTVFFSAAGGGSFSPAQAVISGGTAATTYTSGDSGGITEVTLTAFVDVPRVGRVSGTGTITLLRETLTLRVPCTLALPLPTDGAPPAAVPVTIGLTTDQPGVEGRYPLRLTIRDGRLAESPQAISAGTLTLRSSAASVTAYYTPPLLPAGTFTATDELCIALENQADAPTCVPILLSRPLTSLSATFTPIADQPHTIPDLRVQPLNPALVNGAEVAALLSYRVAADLTGTAPDQRLSNAQGSPFTPGECRPVTPLYNGGIGYVEYRAVTNGWLAAWQLAAPGTDGSPVITTGETFITGRQASVIAPVSVALSDGGTLEVAQPGVAQSSAAQPSALIAHLAAPPPDPAGTVPALFGVFVPDAQIDLTTGTVRPDINGIITGYADAALIGTGITLGLRPAPGMTALRPDYLSPATVLLVNDAAWRLIVIRGDVPAAALRVP